METATISGLRNNLKYYCDEAEKGNDIFVSRSGTGVVLISMEKYGRMMEEREEFLHRITEYGRMYRTLVMGNKDDKEEN